MQSPRASIETFFGSVEALKTFKTLMRDGDKIEYIYNLPMTQTLLKLDEKKGFSDPQGAQKSPFESKKYRDLGNSAFVKSKDNLKSLRLYNEAVIHSPTPSRKPGSNLEATGNDLLMPLAVANRSAVLVKLKRWNEALEDVDLALEQGHPNKSKLLERKAHIEKELELLKEKDTSSNDSPMKNDGITTKPNGHFQSHYYPGSSANSGFSSCVKIVCSEEQGRFAIANRDVGAGEVLMIDDPVCVVPKDKSLKDHCANCLRFCHFRQIPCEKCISSRYCSQKCKNVANYFSKEQRNYCSPYHHFECCTESSALYSAFKEMQGEALDFSRLSFRAVNQKNLEFFVKYQDLLLPPGCQDFNKGPKLGQEVESYLALSNFVNHRSTKSLEKGLFWIYVCAAFNLHYLKQRGYFNQGRHHFSSSGGKIVLDGDEKLIGELLMHFLSVMQYNTHGIIEQVLNNKDGGSLDSAIHHSIANAVYPHLALLNHSCDHNILKCYQGDKVVVIAAKNIKKGEEISENYFPHIKFMAKEDRQIWLKEHYNFVCHCHGCQMELSPKAEVLPNCKPGNLPKEADCSHKKGLSHKVNWHQTIEQLDSLFFPLEKWQGKTETEKKKKHFVQMLRYVGILKDQVDNSTELVFKWSQRSDALLNYLFGNSVHKNSS